MWSFESQLIWSVSWVLAIYTLDEVFIVLHWFQPESGGIRAIPGIPEESNLAEGPAKLIKWFRRNFERNSNSAGMVPGITRKECIPGTRWNGILGELLFVDNVQIERRRLPMIDLGVINKQLHSTCSGYFDISYTLVAHEPDASDTLTKVAAS